MTSSSDPFIKDRLPQDGDCVEVLCEDRRGAYVLPFPCRRTEGAWRNAGTGGALEADVVGWRSRSQEAAVAPVDREQVAVVKAPRRPSRRVTGAK